VFCQVSLHRNEGRENEQSDFLSFAKLDRLKRILCNIIVIKLTGVGGRHSVSDTSARASESESGPTHWQSWSRSRRGIDVTRHHGDRDLDSTRDIGGTDGPSGKWGVHILAYSAYKIHDCIYCIFLHILCIFLAYSHRRSMFTDVAYLCIFVAYLLHILCIYVHILAYFLLAYLCIFCAYTCI
jgi:hypothetical protein